MRLQLQAEYLRTQLTMLLGSRQADSAQAAGTVQVRLWD